MKFLKKPLLLLLSLLGGIAALVFELSRPPAESRTPLLQTGPAAALAPAELVTQLQTLQSERQATSTKVAALEAEVRQLKKQLAVQATSPTAQTAKQEAAAQTPKQQAAARQTAETGADSPAEAPFAQAVLDLAVKAGRLNAQIQLHPELDIPELQYLDEGDWIHFAKEADLDSEGGVRKVLADLRQRAKDRFAPIAMQALSSYAKANGGQSPVSLSQLAPYFPNTTDPTSLDRYNLVPANSPQQQASSSIGGPMILREKAPVDPEYDTAFDIGPTGWTSATRGMGYVHKIN